MSADASECLLYVSAREDAYRYLFAGELPFDDIPEAEMGLSGLASSTYLRGAHKEKLRQHIANLPDIIRNVLEEQDLVAMGESGEPALYAFRSDADRDRVAALVTSVFTIWELTCDRRGMEPLLQHSFSESRWLVLETAAAIMAAGIPTNNINLDKSSDDSELLVYMISRRGPTFVRQWFDGTIVAQWLDREAVDDEERSEWLSLLTPSTLKHIGAYADPLQALSRLRLHVNNTLSDENLAQTLEWAPAEVEQVFTPAIKRELALTHAEPLAAARLASQNLKIVLTDENLAHELSMSLKDAQTMFPPYVRRLLAITYLKDPLKVARRVKYNLEVVLSDDNLSRELGMPIEEVRAMFIPSTKAHLAVSHIGHPFEAAQRIRHILEVDLREDRLAAVTHWDIDKIQTVFTPGVLRQIAVRYSASPRSAVEKICRNLDTLLTDESLSRHLDMPSQAVRYAFPNYVRIALATENIADPLTAARVFHANLQLLTDANLAKLLNVSEQEVCDKWPMAYRYYVALNSGKNISNVVTAFWYDLTCTLSDANLAAVLKITETQACALFPPSVKLRFASGKHGDPLEASRDWLEGRLSLGKDDLGLQNKLAQMGFSSV